MIARYLTGLEARVKGKWRYLGKIIRVGDKYVFLRVYEKEVSIHRNIDALSFDVRVLPELKKYGVTEVHHLCKKAKEMYQITLADAIAKAIPDNQGEGDELYVRVPDWTMVEPQYADVFGKKVIQIQTPQVHRSKPKKRDPRYTKPVVPEQESLFEGKVAKAGRDE
jgi:hypothetical protein